MRVGIEETKDTNQQYEGFNLYLKVEEFEKEIKYKPLISQIIKRKESYLEHLIIVYGQNLVLLAVAIPIILLPIFEGEIQNENLTVPINIYLTIFSIIGCIWSAAGSDNAYELEMIKANPTDLIKAILGLSGFIFAMVFTRGLSRWSNGILLISFLVTVTGDQFIIYHKIYGSSAFSSYFLLLSTLIVVRFQLAFNILQINPDPLFSINVYQFYPLSLIEFIYDIAIGLSFSFLKGFYVKDNLVVQQKKIQVTLQSSA